MADAKTSLKDREIFAVGNWRGSATVAVDQAFIEKMIHSYVNLNAKVSGFAIPVKLGHNKRIGEPAYGYAENIRFDMATGKVIADLNDMDPQIVDAVDQKKYNTVSVEIWPEVTYGGQTYENVLGGVALLGAEWPAVKGLKPLSSFADDGEPLQLSQEEDKTMNFTQEQHDTLMAAEVAKVTLAEAAKTEAENNRADRAEAALAAFTDEAEKAAITTVITAAEKAGKIVPANKASIETMAEAIRVTVDPAKRKAALAAFSTFVEQMPAKVKFTETGASKQGDKTVEAGERAGDTADTRAKALLSEKKAKTYREALDMVFAADPDLKTAYAEENR